jgi:hypothetical protein
MSKYRFNWWTLLCGYFARELMFGVWRFDVFGGTDMPGVSTPGARNGKRPERRTPEGNGTLVGCKLVIYPYQQLIKALK